MTLTGTTGRMYVNGVQVAQNTNMTLTPSSMGNTTQNYIGKSQYDDPLLNAAVDDFQIYDRALSASEITALQTAPGAGNVASYKFDEAERRDRARLVGQQPRRDGRSRLASRRPARPACRRSRRARARTRS